jgi:hypothetical protein
MTTTTTALDLDAIAGRDMNATPGPWGLIGDDEIGLGAEKTGVGYSYDVVLVQVAPESDRLNDLVHNPNQFRIKLGTVKADAEFIAHARQDVPALLAEVKRLRSEISKIADAAMERTSKTAFNDAYERGQINGQRAMAMAIYDTLTVRNEVTV